MEVFDAVAVSDLAMETPPVQGYTVYIISYRWLFAAEIAPEGMETVCNLE